MKIICAIETKALLLGKLRRFAYAVMQSTKKEGCSKTANAEEFKAAKSLLKFLLDKDIAATYEEVNSIIPG